MSQRRLFLSKNDAMQPLFSEVEAIIVAGAIGAVAHIMKPIIVDQYFELKNCNF